MELGEAVIVAGIGSRKGVSAAEVVAAVDAALREHGLVRAQLAKLATTGFKRGEAGIFEAGRMMGLEVVVVDVKELPPPLTPPHKGEGDQVGASAIPSETEAREALDSPSPLWGGVRGGGSGADHGAVVAQSPSRSRAALDTSPPDGGEEGGPSSDRSAPPLTCLPASSPRERGEERTAPTLSLALAGVPSVSEAAALAAVGEGARLAGPRLATGRVTCAIAYGGGR